MEKETSSQEDFLELLYNEDDQSYSFTMPAEDVCIIVSVSDGPQEDEAEVFVEETPTMMLLAATAGDDDDEDWDDATQIETNKYYFTRKKGTYSLSSSLVNAQSNDHMKNVRYTVDGVTKKVQPLSNICLKLIYLYFFIQS